MLALVLGYRVSYASMKALPKRKGNPAGIVHRDEFVSLNESPSEKEGKC